MILKDSDQRVRLGYSVTCASRPDDTSRVGRAVV